MLKKIVLAGLLALLPLAAHAAQPTVTGGGPRLGLSSNPDQFVLGGQLTIGGFAPDWSFDPSLEFGIGDNVTVIQLNADANYHFRLQDSDWAPYVGGGLGIASFSIDLPAPLRDHSETNLGVNVIGGVSVPTAAGNRWFGELRFGLGDIPDIKFIGGINFKL
jgi:Outer membrane protein beta-barrel domain